MTFSENSRSTVPDLKGDRLAAGGSLLHAFLVHVGGRKPSDLKTWKEQNPSFTECKRAGSK